MSTRELVIQELDSLPEHEFDELLKFVRSLKEAYVENHVPMLAAETSLSEDWLSPTEAAAWADL